RDLLGLQQALVDDRARRQARDVEALRVAQVRRRADLLLDRLADHVQLALESDLVVHAAAGRDEDLADLRHRRARQRTRLLRIDRYRAPAEQTLPLLAHDLLEDLETDVALEDVARQEHHADAVLAHRRQHDSLRQALAQEELVRDLQHHAGAVAGQRIAAARAAVLEVAQDLQPLLDDVVGLLAAHVDDEADAAGVACRHRAVEASLLGQPSPLAHRLDVFAAVELTVLAVFDHRCPSLTSLSRASITEPPTAWRCPPA